MPVLKLTPTCKDYPWGGERLRTTYHVQSDLVPLAEAWVLSTHLDGPSVVAEGPDVGKTLAQYIAEHPGCVGTHGEEFHEFPVLVKLIDAQQDLSIQVHPDDAYALAHEGQYGKTEMWLVLEAESGAHLFYGFRRRVTREEFVTHIEHNTLPDLLNAVPVHKGDVFFVPSGTLHAIGKGIVVAEVQQNSNVTYRVYDHGRLGADEKPRPLHIDQAIAVTDLSPTKKQNFGPHLAQCRYFTADIRYGTFIGSVDRTSFVSLLVIDGAGSLCCGGASLSVQKGDSFFLPAGSGNYLVQGEISTLITYL